MIPVRVPADTMIHDLWIGELWQWATALVDRRFPEFR